MPRFLVCTVPGQSVRLCPRSGSDDHLVGAIARLDVTREEVVVMFRSGQRAILFHIDEQSRFSDFESLYNYATGYNKETKCKVVVWIKPCASVDRCTAEAQAWWHAHPEELKRHLFPSYYFPRHGLNVKSNESLHLIRYLRENTSNSLLKKLRESGMLEFEDVSCMTNAIIMRMQGTANVNAAELAHQLGQRTRRGLSAGVILVKDRYLTSKLLKDTCMALEAYQGVDMTTQFDRCQVMSHPHAQLLHAFEVLCRFNSGKLGLLSMLDFDEPVMFDSLDGWYSVDVAAMRSAVERLPLMQHIRNVNSWVQLHQKLHDTEFESLSSVLAPFVLLATSTRPAGPGEQLRREVSAATETYLAGRDRSESGHEALAPLKHLSEHATCPLPYEINAIVETALRDHVGGSFHDVVAPLYARIAAAYVSTTQHDHDARVNEYQIQIIKTLCSDAKALCDANSQLDEAQKLYSSAQDICKVTDMRGSKRSSVIARCRIACENHAMSKLTDSLYNTGNLDSKKYSDLKKLFNSRQ